MPTAFAAWGATVGVGAALGPVVGGFLTTNYSWRWAFGINVIVAPLAIVGAMVFISRSRPPARRIPIDVPGAILVASGMFLFVFARVKAPATAGSGPCSRSRSAGRRSARRPRVSITPLVMVLAAVVLFCFYRLERWKERHDRSPLFEFGQLRHRGFRYGLITTSVLAYGSARHVLRAADLPAGRQASLG